MKNNKKIQEEFNAQWQQIGTTNTGAKIFTTKKGMPSLFSSITPKEYNKQLTKETKTWKEYNKKKQSKIKIEV